MESSLTHAPRLCVRASSAQTLESISGLFTPQRANAPAGGRGGRGGFGNSANAKLHNQWPGTGAVGTPELAQLVASQGGSFGNGMGLIKDSQVAVWQKNGAEMLELPLKVVTPLFLASLRGIRAQKKVSVDATIPDLFSGGTAPEAIPTGLAAPVAPVVPAAPVAPG